MEILFYLSAPLLLLSGIPQTLKLLRTKRSHDISIATYAMTWLAVSILFVDSVMVLSQSLALANFTSLVTVSVNLYLIIYYRVKSKYT